MSVILIKNGTLVTEDGKQQADVLIENGIVSSIRSPNPNPNPRTDIKTIDASGLYILPGLIDCHVHFREPGYEEAENMESGAQSALAGGVTTVCDMPNTTPPTSTKAALEDKLERARRIKDCDIRLFFNVMNDEHLEELKQINPDDICGVKIYMDHSTGNLGASQSAIEGAFKLCAEKGIVVTAHCEDPQMNEKAKQSNPQKSIEEHSANRPPESEAKAIHDAIALAKQCGTHLHVAHLSTKHGLDLVRRAKADGQNVTCEVAPHHLFLSVDDYEHLGALCKMNPPVRTKDHCQALWEGVIEGTIDCIATDHAPHTSEAKQNENPLEAPSGVPGVETLLPLLLSCAFSDGPKDHTGNSRLPTTNYQLQPTDLFKLLFKHPNDIYQLGKPGITEGQTADLILVNPEETWKIHGKELNSRCGWTPYEGWEVTGALVNNSL